MKKKTFIVQMLDSKTPSKKSFTQVEDALFYSNDTDAHLVFLPHEQESFEFNEAIVALYNTDDESLVERPAMLETFEGRKSVVLKMTEDLLAHWGRWQAQVVFKQGNKINTSVVVKFDTMRYMLDQRPPTLRDIIKVDELYSQLVIVMDEIAGKDVISAPEIILARGGESTLGERLDKEHNEVTAQLAQKITKNLGEITSSDLSQEVKDMMTGGDSSVEVEQARVDASGHTNATLKERLDKEHNEVTEQLEQIHYNVTAFGAKGDNETLNGAIINSVIDLASAEGGVVYLPPGKYIIEETLLVPGNVTLRGSGMGSTNLYTNTNDFNAIETVVDAYRVVIEDLSIYSLSLVGTNVGIMGNNGGEHVYRNINIWTFKHGIKTGEVWWNNTVENVRVNDCDVSLYGKSTIGQNINNVFNRFYSNKPNELAIYMYGFKNTVFLGCNFGGMDNINSMFIDILLSRGIRFITCNFEHINLAQDTGTIQIWGDCEVTFDGCLFVLNKTTGTRAFQIFARDNAVVKVSNCATLSAEENMTDFYSINDSQIIVDNCPTMTTSIVYSTKPIIDVLAELKKVNTLFNNATGTRLKYWAGSQEEYDAIDTYDLDTVYDIW